MDLENSRTFENLRKAYFSEASLAYRYLFYAIVADYEGLDKFAKLFKEFHEGGTSNAHGCLDFLRLIQDPDAAVPVGGTMKNMEALLQTEISQFSEIYPEMARVAREEGFTDIASWFDTLEKLKRSHSQKLRAPNEK